MADPDLHVTVDDLTLAANWTDDSPETRAAIADALPLAGDATRWGDELYFRVSVEADPENAQAVVEEGTVAYWPQGPALCLFWGPTPASTDGRPRAASPVNVVARVEDVGPLAGVDGGARMRIGVEG
ncbi:MAG: cyclophilin-like family protein [Haloferacaceae archaeon]